MNVKKRIAIISAELSTLTPNENSLRTSSLENALKTKGYIYNEALGSYKGSLEKSFIIDASEDIIKDLMGLARFFKQESILVVDELQNAVLMYSNGKNESIGQMNQINSAKGLESWTLVNGLFYTVK